MVELSAKAKEVLEREYEKRIQLEYGCSSAELKEKLERNKARADAFSIIGLTKESPEVKDYSFARVTLGLISGDMERHASMELSLSKQLAAKMPDQAYAQGTAPDSAGGVLVPTIVANDLRVDVLRPKNLMTRLGVVTRDFSAGTPVEIPAVTKTVQPETVAENQASGESSMEFAMLRAEPKTTQVALRGSDRFWRMGVQAEELAREHIARELDLYEDEWGIHGTGFEGQPIGVLQAAGIPRISFAGTTELVNGELIPTFKFYRQLLAMRRSLKKANAMTVGRSIKWASAIEVPDVARLVHGQNTTLAGGSEATAEFNRHVITEGDVTRMLSYPIEDDSRLAGGGANTDLVFGAWDTINKITWGGMTLRATNVGEGTFMKRQTLLMAHTDLDYVHRYPEAFAIAQDLNTAGL